MNFFIVGAVCCSMYQLSCEKGTGCSTQFDEGEHCSDISVLTALHRVSIYQIRTLGYCKVVSVTMIHELINPEAENRKLVL